MEAILAAILEALETLAGAALGALASLARLFGLGSVQVVKAARGRLALRQYHRGPAMGERPPRPLWSPQLARRLILAGWGPAAGTIAAAARGASLRLGATVGAALVLVLIVAELRHRRARLARARAPRVLRLFNLARATWSIPTETGAAWWVKVVRWERWPEGILPGVLPLTRSLRRRRRALARLEREAGRPTFPALVRWRLPDDYHPSQHEREDFAERLAEVTAMTETGWRWALRWDLPHHGVFASLEPAAIAAPYPVSWPAPERPQLIPVGVLARTRELACWNAGPAADPHGAIAGRTGTGKTVALGTIIIGAGRAGWDVFLVDGKSTGLGMFAGRQGIRAVALEREAWWAAIERVYADLQARKRAVAQGGSIERRPPVLLVVDEIQTVLALERGRSAEVQARNVPALEAQRKLTEIAQQGRSLGVHYWPAGQRLAAVAVEGPMRENLTALLVLRSSRVGSVQAMESTAAANLPKVPGRAAWTDATHEADELQVLGWAPEVPDAPSLDELLPLQRPRRRLEVVEPAEPEPADAAEIIG